MKADRVLFAVALAALLGAPAAAAPPVPKPAPEAPKGAVLDFGRWLEEKLRRLAGPFAPGNPAPPSAGPRFDAGTTACDPSRSHCPIG